MNIKLISIIMLICIFSLSIAGCGKKNEWITDESWIEVSGSEDEESEDAKGEDIDNTSKTETNSSKDKDNNSSTTSSKTKKPQNTKPDVSKAIQTTLTGKDPNANYNVSGKISVSVNTNRPTDYEAMFDSFQSVYKNVELEIKYFSDGDSSLNYILKQASIGNLPDVVFDDAAPLPTYVAQGLVHSLDSYVQNDPDIKYVSSEILNSYKYSGKLYALPNSIHFSSVMINKDIVKALNLKMPSLSWNVNDMVDFLKKGTTDKYSGCEQLFGNDYLAAQLCPYYDTSVGMYGYDYKNNVFKLNSMTQALKLTADLRKYPGLEAFALRMSGIDKYSAKFGNSNTSDTRMALKLGRTLVEFDSGTWEDPNLSNFKFNNTLWPYPQSEKGRMPIHVDHSFMISSTKNPDTAFQLLRYITYSTEGNLARLGMYNKTNKDKYVLASKFYIPVTSNPEVKKEFNSLGVSDVYQYMYDNIDKCYRADPKKFVPGFTDTIQSAISEWDKVMDGVADASVVNSTLEGKLNTAISKYKNEFDAKVAKNNK